MAEAVQKYRFQFYLSSIKSGIDSRLTSAYGEFQFYLSSIKSTSVSHSELPPILFQFYLSSIKRQTDRYMRFHGSVWKTFRRFNSTLVQLKAL